MSKLTEATAAEIRASDDGSADAAARFGVSPSTVWRVRTGRAWGRDDGYVDWPAVWGVLFILLFIGALTGGLAWALQDSARKNRAVAEYTARCNDAGGRVVLFNGEGDYRCLTSFEEFKVDER